MTLLGTSRGRMRTSFAALVSSLALFASACGQDGAVAPAKPELPTTPAIPAQYRGAAFIADVSTLSKTVKITPPTNTIRNPMFRPLLAR